MVKIHGRVKRRKNLTTHRRHGHLGKALRRREAEKLAKERKKKEQA